MAMESNANGRSSQAADAPAGVVARTILRTGLKGSLATLDRTSGHPYASLVTVASEVDGTPIVLISRLALHTQNLMADPRASLLIDGTGADGDPLAGGRVTFIGRAEVTTSPDARRRFLARQTAAAGYADFPDFAFWRLEVERAHFIGGFGRIVTLDRGQAVLDLADARSLVEAEAEIVEHMNEDHAAANELYATVLAGKPGGPWRMTGIDPEGCDLVCAGDACRIAFATRVTSPGLARQELVRLVGVARGKGV